MASSRRNGRGLLEASDALPDPPSPALRGARERLAIAQLEREVEKLREMRTELWYYNWGGRLMFLVVHLVLGLGVTMAWTEFRNANSRRRQAASESLQELELSLEGVALKSSLHGTMLLGLALAFYLLYVKFVYPMVVVP